MGKITIISCDLCGNTKDDMPNHWSYCINDLAFKFKNFSNLQQNIEIDYCCSICASNIFDKVEDLIIELTKENKD